MYTASSFTYSLEYRMALFFPPCMYLEFHAFGLFATDGVLKRKINPNICTNICSPYIFFFFIIIFWHKVNFLFLQIFANGILGRARTKRESLMSAVLSFPVLRLPLLYSDFNLVVYFVWGKFIITYSLSLAYLFKLCCYAFYVTFTFRAIHSIGEHHHKFIFAEIWDWAERTAEKKV